MRIAKLVAQVSQKRLVSFGSIADSIQSTSTIPTKLPQVTGHGPFLEAPTFNAVGAPSSLLDIKLPASAVLNLKLSTKASVVGINGNVENLTKELTMIKSSIKPIIYQRIFNTSPLSLLISNHLNFQNFIVLKVKEDWLINESNLIAWHGSEIIPKFSNKLLDTFNSVVATGEGVIALKGNGNIFKIELSEGETMLVNPNNLVAYNSNEISLAKLDTKFLNLKIPTFTSWESIALAYKNILQKIQKLLKIEPSTATSQVTDNKYIKTVNDYLRNRNRNKTNDKLFKVKGPITLVLQNNI